MKKIRFAVQVILLMLSFPVWFISEMKKTDKVFQNNRRVTNDTVQVIKTAVIERSSEPSYSNVAAMPFLTNLIVRN